MKHQQVQLIATNIALYLCKNKAMNTGFVTSVKRRMPLVEQEQLTLPEHLSIHPVFSEVRVAQSLAFCVLFCWSCVCPFVLFILAIVLSVILRLTASDYPFGIFKLFLWTSITEQYSFNNTFLYSIECRRSKIFSRQVRVTF